MEQILLIDKPVQYEKDGDTLTKVNEGWVTEDKETFSRILRRETFYYKDGIEDKERGSDVVMTTLESIKGTMYMKRKIKGTLFDDVQ